MLTYEKLTKEMAAAWWDAIGKESQKYPPRTWERQALDAALALGYLPPEVVAYRIREAEREALFMGGARRESIDRMYPALPDPLAAEPPTLTLSTGVWRRREDGCWEPCAGDKVYIGYVSPNIKTIEDCHKLAAWLSAHGETT